MRVLFQNHSGFIGREGGDTTQILKTKRELESLGCNIDIDTALSPNLSNYDIVHVFNIQTSEVSIKQIYNAKSQRKPVVLSPIFWDMRHMWRITAKISPIYKRLSARLLAKISWRTPYYLGIIKNYSLIRRRYKLAKQALELADLLLPNSYAELEIIALLFDAPWVRTKSVVVPNGADPLNIENCCKSNNREIAIELPSEYVLQVARIEPIKCQLQVIKALMDIKELPLVFIGAGLNEPYGKECLKVAKHRGNTFFLGEIPHEHLSSYYMRAKVHVLPSLRESPGLSTLEAAMYGINCVVSHYGPVNEYFGDKVWYCDPVSIDSIQNAILTAWKTHRKADLADYIRKHFTWEKAANITFTAYQKILNKK